MHNAKGNEFFRQYKVSEAVQSYTAAVNLCPEEAKYFGNRSQAKLRSEDFKGALKDASKAIELDQSYTKAHYRKALANASLGYYATALGEFQRLYEVTQNDEFKMAIKHRMKQCKILLGRKGKVIYCYNNFCFSE